ncbi:MAG TPA: cupin domain-containing protein [Actinomycetota bacterium]|nr:cupin domain-containing protein [Actinomycetota bacterium]
MIPAETPFLTTPAQSEALWLLGGLYTFLATGKQTEDRYTLVEVRGPSGFVIPVHFHEREHEGFYVAEGHATIFLRGEGSEASAGAFAFAPAGVEHAFRLDVEDTRLLLFITPGAAGHEGMFREMGEPAKTRALPPPGVLPDPEHLAAVAASHGTRIVGPPPG